MARMRLKLTTPAEVRKALTRITNMALNGEIDVKTAEIVIRGCNAVLGSIRLDEQQKKIDELERLINEQTPGRD